MHIGQIAEALLVVGRVVGAQIVEAIRNATGQADPEQLREQIKQELMFELNRELGTTLVLVTHDRAIAARCEHRITIEAGQVASVD